MTAIMCITPRCLWSSVFFFTKTVCSPQDVYDKLDYLSSLGKTQTAAVQRDADIGVAEAERDAGIRVKDCATVMDNSPKPMNYIY